MMKPWKCQVCNVTNETRLSECMNCEAEHPMFAEVRDAAQNSVLNSGSVALGESRGLLPDGTSVTLFGQFAVQASAAINRLDETGMTTWKDHLRAVFYRVLSQDPDTEGLMRALIAIQAVSELWITDLAVRDAGVRERILEAVREHTAEGDAG